MSDEFEIPREWVVRGKLEKAAVQQLGDQIGYGRMMQLAQECLRDNLTDQGLEGGEFAYGPCVTFTVPCGCNGSCDWCYGSKWLTKSVKKIKDEFES